MKLAQISLSLLVTGFAAIRLPAAVADLPRSTPEAQGVSSQSLLSFIAAAEEKINALHSFMLVRRGHVVAEGWWAPYAPDLPHQMFSLSKSFTSTAVGLAIADGKFSVDDPVLKFFPEEAPAKPSANLRAMRVRDLLTMSTGHHNEDLQNFPYGGEESVVQKFLALPVAHKPGTLFVYNTPATYMLSAIVQKTTGQPLLEYLRPRLFEPLGIAHPTWEASKQGVSMGGFGLSIRTEDIARFGQLYLQRGQWHGRSLVPASWVETATSRWMSNGSNPASDWEQGYGFQFWRCRYGIFRGDGAHGQFCVVFPELDAVVAITAGTRDLQGVLTVLWDRLLPALQTKTVALPEDGAAQKRLADKLGHLSLRTPVSVEPSATARSAASQRYIFPPNSSGFEAISLHAATGAGSAAEVKARIRGEDFQVNAGSGRWQRGELGSAGKAEPVSTSGAWTGPDTFTLELVRIHTPFSTRYQFLFKDEQVLLTIVPNVGPTSPTPVHIVGRRE